MFLIIVEMFLMTFLMQSEKFYSKNIKLIPFKEKRKKIPKKLANIRLFFVFHETF